MRCAGLVARCSSAAAGGPAEKLAEHVARALDDVAERVAGLRQDDAELGAQRLHTVASPSVSERSVLATPSVASLTPEPSGSSGLRVDADAVAAPPSGPGEPSVPGPVARAGGGGGGG